MNWVRNTGFVIALVGLASLISLAAIRQQSDRRLRTVARVSDVLSEAEFLPDFAEPLANSRVEAREFARLGAHRLVSDNSERGQVLPALQIVDVQTDSRRTRQAGNSPESVPAPADTLPDDSESEDESHPDPEGTSAVREVIERELAHTTREERDIWFDELKTLPAGVVRDLLQVRKQLRALPRLLGGMPEKLASTDPAMMTRNREISAEPASQKIRFHLTDYSPAATALETAISQLRHNLTNASTPGFKRLRVTLSDCYLSTSSESESTGDLNSEQPRDRSVRGDGCRVAPLQIDLKQGQIRKTGRPLDLAIDGDGFFVVKRGERVLLTRCGAFALDRDRQLCLVIADDRIEIQPVIVIPDNANEIQVSSDGTISAVKTGETASTRVGQLQLARVASPTRLRPLGQSLFSANEASGSVLTSSPMTDGTGNIHQGCLEQSNVDLQSELDEIEELTSILNSLPLPSGRPVTANGSQTLPPR